MISHDDIVKALTPFLSTFAAKLSDEQWQQYALALEHVNPGDLDDALADLRKTHAFRNAPLPAEILERVHVHRQHRILNARLFEDEPIKADPSEGEWKTHTIPGLGSVRMHVLPDDHPALHRFRCGRCHDTGFEERGLHPISKKSIYLRCGCRKKTA